jgi:hypothetical protein
MKCPDSNKLGYAALTLGVVLGLFFSWVNDNAIERVNTTQQQLIDQQREFIVEQCDRDKFRNSVVITALKAAKQRAEDQYKDDPGLARLRTADIQSQINRFNGSDGCKLP